MSYVIDFGHEGNYPIYGIRFNGSNPGTRLYNAANLNFSPSNTISSGIDDFITIKDSPFAIKECVIQYNSSTGKQEVLGYEGDNNWNTLVANKIGNRMIEFPKFYYRRPSQFEWHVSSYPLKGFKPSPMHYRNGRMLDKFYVSKYMAGENTMTSQPGQVIANGLSDDNDPNGRHISYYRNIFRSKHCYLIDYATVSSIAMLMIIKYGTLNAQLKVGNGNTISTNLNDGNFESSILPTGSADNIKGKDGYGGATVSSVGPMIAFGIENYWGNLWSTIDGVVTRTNKIYINTNIENMSYYPSFSNMGDYKEVSTNCALNPAHNGAFGWIVNALAYDSIYDWAMYPTNCSWVADGIDRNYDNQINFLVNDGYWNWWDTSLIVNDFCWVGSLGCLFNGNSCGPLCFSTNMNSYAQNRNVAAFFVAIIE